MSASDRFNRCRDLADDKPVKVDLGAGVIDVDADQLAGGVVVQHHAFGDLSTVRARLLRQVDVQRAGVGKVIGLHLVALPAYLTYPPCLTYATYQTYQTHLPPTLG